MNILQVLTKEKRKMTLSNSLVLTEYKLHFNVNDELNRVVVTVVDASTNEIIREIPSKDIQRIQARMKHAIGVLFDEMI